MRKGGEHENLNTSANQASLMNKERNLDDEGTDVVCNDASSPTTKTPSLAYFSPTIQPLDKSKPTIKGAK